MDIGKWLVRGGILLLLLGFVLPSITVSCGGVPDARVTYSLANMAYKKGELVLWLLYLVPLGALAALLITFIPPVNPPRALFLFLGELAGVGIGLVGVIISGLLFMDEISAHGLSVRPSFGALFLLGGYGLIGIGMLLEIAEMIGIIKGRATFGRRAPPYTTMQEAIGTATSPAVSPQYPPSPYGYPAPYRPPAPHMMPTAQAGLQARLEVFSSSMAHTEVQVLTDSFSIGRGAGNDLNIPDPSVSRQHARLRYAEGAWFIQDQGSSGGILVNDVPVFASRLKSGDRVTIGNTSIIFWNP